jgi:hypothetical protein
MDDIIEQDDFFRQLEQNFKDKGDAVMLYKLGKLRRLGIISEEDLFDLENKLNAIPIEDDIKPILIEDLRVKTSEYIYSYIPNYRQINFTNAKVNISLILSAFSSLYTDEEKQNAINILKRIIAMEIWVSQIIAKFYEIVSSIINSDVNSAIDLYYNYKNIYDTIQRPAFLESKDIAYIQTLIARII